MPDSYPFLPTTPFSTKRDRHIDMPYREASLRMDSLTFTRSLMRPRTPEGYCHCVVGKPFPEKRLLFGGKDNQHCTICGPECVGRAAQEKADLKRETLPPFEEWQKTNGAAALRAVGKATVWTKYAYTITGSTGR